MLPEYINKAELLSKKYSNFDELLIHIQRYLWTHFNNVKKRYEAKSILESRYTPSLTAFKIGMDTCGSKTNIVADMLRHLGYEVKKVHGSIPESHTHAWIQVKKDKVWKQYDISYPNCKITSEHKAIAVCNEWNELEKVIRKEFLEDINLQLKVKDLQ